MTDEEFLQKLRESFAIEAAEHAQTIVGGLIELEQHPPETRRGELVEAIFRSAHSLKGAARAVSRGDIEAVCQALETVFAAWKRQPGPVPVEAFDVLNAAVDLVTGLLTRSEAATSVQEKGLVAAMVKSLAALGTVPSQGSAEPPRSAHPGPPQPSAEDQHQPLEPDRVAVAQTVRVPMAKVDSLLLQVEELVGVKLGLAQHASELRETRDLIKAWRRNSDSSRLSVPGRGEVNGDATAGSGRELINLLDRKLTDLSRSAEHDARAVGTRVDDLLDHAKQLVMLPCGTLLDGFPKLVRDLARDQGKEILLTLQGRDVEIDKRILEQMKDPLLHLVRNAIDHGFETPAQRVASGKAEQGTLTISVAQREGSKVEIVVLDDGAGIDPTRVRAAAIKEGAVTEQEANELDEAAALQLIFRSGVSTSPMITEISGRGLGMAIVRDNVEKLGGQITVGTRAGVGSSFRVLLPVTLATFQGVLVTAGGQNFVIPTAAIERIVRVRREEIRTVAGRETVALAGQTVSLVSLAEVLQMPAARLENGTAEAVVLGTAEKRIAFIVDAVVAEQEVLVKTLGKPLIRVRNVAGATLLGSGTPVVILNSTDLLKSAARAPASSGVGAMESSDASRTRRILIADDSLTSRMLLKNILSSAGYSVTTAVDGMEAFSALRGGGFDLVVSDVEMPRLDGFELTSKIRSEKSMTDLPVVLVTALDAREHRERGVRAGANAYIVKSSFDQTNLLEVIRRLIGP